MSKGEVKEKINNRWDQAIADARDTIQKCQRKIESMKTAIKIFEESRDEGVPWPGQLKGLTSEQQQSGAGRG